MGLRDEYQLGRKLGEGGAGEVFQATRRRDGLPVAIKFSLGRDGGIPQERERFADETKLLAQLRSPYVIRVLDAGVDEGRLYYVMEYVEGKTLGDFVRAKGGLSPALAYRIAWALARALEAAHKLGIVHRDVKPANVMVDGEGRPRLTDFGLAKGTRSGVRTKTGIILGTPGYMAPEVLEGKPATPAADIYALGTILYLCLTGRALFQEENLGDLMRAQLSGPDDEDLARLSTIEQRAVQRLTARDPQERPSAGEAANRLKELAESHSEQMRPEVATKLQGALSVSGSGELPTTEVSGTRPAGQATRQEDRPASMESSPPAWAREPEPSGPVATPVHGLGRVLLAGGLGLLLLGLFLGRWVFAPGPTPTPVPGDAVVVAGPEEGSGVHPDDAEVARWTDVLGGLDFDVSMRELGDAGQALTPEGPEATAALQALSGQLTAAGIPAAVDELATRVDAAWWHALPREEEARREALGLRRRLLRHLVELERWNQVFFALSGTQEPFAVARRLRRPVLRYREAAPPPSVAGDEAPGAVRIFRGCDSPGSIRDNRRCANWNERMEGTALTPMGPSETYCFDLIQSGEARIPQCDRLGSYDVPRGSAFGDGDWWVVSLGVAFLDDAELVHVELVPDELEALAGIPLRWHPPVRGEQMLMPEISLAEAAVHRDLLPQAPRAVQVVHADLGWPLAGSAPHWYTLIGLGLRRQADFP